MIPLESQSYVCFCPCCCLSGDPAHSDTEPLHNGIPYNRRMDCSCKLHWPYCVERPFDPPTPSQLFRMLQMRARDLGRPELAQRSAELATVVETLMKQLGSCAALRGGE